MITTKDPIIFFDTETTGIIKDNKGKVSSNGSLIQIAYRKLEGGKKTDNNIFINTDNKIEIGAIATHGIYKELLEEKSEKKYLEDDTRKIIAEVLTSGTIVAHHIAFDADVLGKSDIEYSKSMIDTLKVAKILLSEGVFAEVKEHEPEYVNLQYLRYYFELYKIVDENGDEENTTAHDAFGDVVVLENIFYALFEIIKSKLNLGDDEIIDIMKKMTQKEFLLIKTMMVGKYRGKTFEEVAKIDKKYLDWMIGADFTDDIKYTCSVWLGEEKDKKFFS